MGKSRSMGADLNFGRTYHERIEKIAIVVINTGGIVNCV
jgi:hypothetical protein